jgi:MICOS complex subunit MIC19
LDSNKESNSTRSATLEAHIQSRVQAELARLEARSESLQDKLEEALKKQGLLTERESTNLSSVTLEGDIKELRDKFVGVKNSKQDVEARKAREELVRCLQLHDRRSLDCWWEVKQFKEKVANLEREFVNKNQ